MRANANLNQLPRGWVRTKVGDIFEFAYGKGLVKKARKEIGPYPVYGSSGIVGFHDEYVATGPKVIVGRKGAAGAVHYCNKNCWPIDTTYFINSINIVDSKFSYYLLKSLRLNQFETSTAIPGLNRDDAYRLDISLPPLNEQKRIVAKIEALFSELDNGISALKTAREQLKVYRQAVLKHAFEGKLTAKWREGNADKLEAPEQLLVRIQQERDTRYQQQLEAWKAAVKEWEVKGKAGKKPSKPTKPPEIQEVQNDILPALPKGWCWVEYAGICEQIRNGISAKPCGESGAKIFRISAVRPMQFNLEDIRYLKNDDGQFDKYFLDKGDLVFTRYNGTKDYVGVCAEYQGDGTHLYPDKLIQTRLAIKSISPSYLEKAINCGGSRRYIELRIRTTAGQAGISGEDVKTMPVPICSAEEQKIIEEHIAAQLSHIVSMSAEIDSGIAKSETLRQSILKKAFSGQLVPQDPNDEPACELLARIKANKTKEPQSKRKVKA